MALESIPKEELARAIGGPAVRRDINSHDVPSIPEKYHQ
jgi:hypothetical protein